MEPQVPQNLKNLNRALKSFIELLEIDKDLIDSASKRTEKEPELDIEKSVSLLSEKEKSDFLVGLAKEESLLNIRLIKRLKELSHKNIRPQIDPGRRTIGEIIKEAEKISKKRKEKEKKEKEAARIRKLEELAKQEEVLWTKVHRKISMKKPNSYDMAIEILKDLKDLAEYKNRIDEYQDKINQIIEEYKRLSSLKSKIKNSGL